MVPTETESDHVRAPGLHISGENRHHTYCSKTTNCHKSIQSLGSSI